MSRAMSRGQRSFRCSGFSKATYKYGDSCFLGIGF